MTTYDDVLMTVRKKNEYDDGKTFFLNAEGKGRIITFSFCSGG